MLVLVITKMLLTNSPVQAADKLGEVREEIAEAVEEIPGILSNTKVVAELYADQEAVHRAASALYVSVIGILQYILVWFKQKAIGEPFSLIVNIRMADINR